MRPSELTPWWSIGAAITMPLVRLMFRLRVEGIANVPANGPALLVFNHVSVLDGPVLAIVVARLRRREMRFLVAAEVFERPFVGLLLRVFDQIPIRRGEGDVHALDEAIRTVNAGAIAAIAPEGRVNEDPAAGLQRMRAGAARLALPTGAQVVPVGIWGTQARWPRDGLRVRRPWRPLVTLVFGDALRTGDDTGDDRTASDVDAFTSRMAAELSRQVSRARAIAHLDQGA